MITPIKYFLIVCAVCVVSWFILLQILTPNLVDEDYLLTSEQIQKKITADSVQFAAKSNLQFFGFALTDCQFDDPTTSEVETSYFSEVQPFSNIGHLCAFTPEQNITTELEMYAEVEIQALLYVENIFFERRHGGNKSGEIVSLRSDYQMRWQAFVQENELERYQDTIAAYYFVDEPYWNSVLEADMQEVSAFLEKQYPETAQFVVLAYTTVGQEEVNIPATIDYVGYNQYGVPNPNAHAEYVSDINLLSDLLGEDQEIFIIFESQWMPLYDKYGFTKDMVGTMTAYYYEFALSQPKVTGMIGYVWPNEFDGLGFVGARDLVSVHQYYQAIFAEISKR